MHPEVATNPTSGGHVFFWNVSDAVGINGVNRPDDVLFVQFCLRAIAKMQPIDQDFLVVLGHTPLNGQCTGRDGDTTIQSIKYFQKKRKLKEDGRVSRARGPGYKIGGGQQVTFLVHYLNAALRKNHSSCYPRLDLIPGFPQQLHPKVVDPFI